MHIFSLDIFSNYTADHRVSITLEQLFSSPSYLTFIIILPFFSSTNYFLNISPNRLWRRTGSRKYPVNQKSFWWFIWNGNVVSPLLNTHQTISQGLIKNIRYIFEHELLYFEHIW